MASSIVDIARGPAVQGAAELSVAVVRDLAELEAHAGAWNRLALDAPQAMPQLAHAWVAPFLAHRLRPGEAWAAALAYEGDELRGVACVIIGPHRLLGRLRPMLRAPFDSHTRAGDILLARPGDGAALGALLAALRRVAPGYLGLRLHGVHARSHTLSALAGGLPGWRAVRSGGDMGSLISVEGGYEQFQRGLSDNFRGNLRKAHNKLARLPGVSDEFLAGAEDSRAELARFCAIEASGWKGREGTAIGQSPELVAFYTALTGSLARQGWLEWHFLNAEGRSIAGHLAVRFGATLALAKIGYDESYARCAPGNLLLERLVRRAFQSGDLREIDLQSDMAWHRNWRLRQDEHFDLWLFPAGPLGMLLGALPTRAALYARRRLRPLARRAREELARRRRPPHRPGS